jgi:tRNA U34 5-methylaminomethyl-2-thiouridine-forming methyltransferase MnmC
MDSSLIVATADGSNTLYSQKYNQNFHSCKDGATNESLYKHIIPALTHHKNKDNLRILDICFGLGYNTFLTILQNKKSPVPKKIEIISPELDGKLVGSLKDFSYPDEFQSIKNIIAEVSENKFYEDNFLKITVLIEEAREVVKSVKNIDIVYQDAFSSDTNRELWSVEYFHDIKKAMNLDGILTTYSVATPVRLSLFENDFFIYENKSEFCRRGTLAFLKPQSIDNFVDMQLKKTRNPDAKPIFD